MDEQITHVHSFNDFELSLISLNLDKKVKLLRAFEHDEKNSKKYIRNVGIFVENLLVTSNYTDSVHLMEELSLFESGSEQNKYFEVVSQNKTKNLKLELSDSKNIYFTKSEVRAMYKIYNMAFVGYSMARVLEHEYHFSPEEMILLFCKNAIFDRI